MSAILKIFQEQDESFISISYALELMSNEGDGCQLFEAAAFLHNLMLRKDSPKCIIRPKMLESTTIIADDEHVISILARAADHGYYTDDARDYTRYGFNRKELFQFLARHGVNLDNEPQQNQQQATDPDAAHRLRQLEADNARLVEQVAELEQQLQDATAAPQQAPQLSTAAPQEAPQSDPEKLHPKRQASYETAIAAMLDLLVTNGKWSSEAKLIEAIEANHKISARTLNTLFAEAKLRVSSN